MNNNNPVTFKKHCLATAIACAYMSLAIAPAYASDTEIYVDNTNASNLAPNLMMVFDTSGSMEWCVDSAEEEDCSDVSKRRINVLKKAMKQILRGDAAAGVSAVPGYIKMGLARYHATTERGGYVLYPARPLDALVSINPNGNVNNTVATSNADAIQKYAETTSGTTTTGALKIGLDGTNDYVAGLHFSNVRIPRGATISSAYIELTANADNSGLTTWEISAEATGNASDYSGTQMNSRTYGDVANYAPDAWQTNDVKKVPVTEAINEVVNRADWCGGNALAVRIRDISPVKALRTAYSFNTAATEAQKPRLVVNYTVDPESASCINNVSQTKVLAISASNDDVRWFSDNSGSLERATVSQDINYLETNKSGSTILRRRYSGIRFPNVQIPTGATINSAVLKLYAEDNYTDVQAVTVKGFSSTNVDFCPNGTCLTPTQANALVLTSNGTTWSPGSLTKGYSNAATIDVKNIVIEIVGSNTDVNKHIGFRLWNAGSTSKTTKIRTTDNSVVTSARLEISWTINQLQQLTFLETVRDQIDAEVEMLVAPSGTPLGAAYAEATRYMYGMQPYNKAITNYDSRTVVNAGNTSTVSYVSPIPADDYCSANYIFLLTDGEPLNKANVDLNTKGVMESSSTVCSGVTTQNTKGENIYPAVNWDCMKVLAAYNNGITKANGQPKKRIYTSTMILGPLESAEENMEEVADAGGGKPYTATETSALAAAFTDVINEAMQSSGTITAAGVAVNQLNRLNHLDQLYYAVFDPKPNSLHWQGNLKRYRLGGDGVIYDNSSPPVDAVESSTGFFKPTAKSFWSTTVDGDSASVGGAASKLPEPNDRKMYTYTGALTALDAPVALTKIDLTDAEFNTTAQTKTGTTGDEYTNLMKWYQGYEVNSLGNNPSDATALRKRLGGALHSRPVLINYGYTGELADANDPENQSNYIFFSTMEGTLHAIDAKTGVEKFSFIPGAKLPMLKSLFLDPSSALPEFGMDLTWIYYRKDTDGSGKIGSGDKIWLYGGMRMGGNDYYALDVTDLDNPKLMFAIDGGATGTKYAKMGQTWSEPVIASIYVEGKPTKVMIFGGGYDDKHEQHNLALPFANVDKGNQVYIVDAEKGDLLWMASGNSSDTPDKYVDDMKFSIPSAPKAIDLDSDGIADVIYIGDLGGQVFRIDLDKKATTKANIAKRVRTIAKVGQTESATLASQRRFYEPPAVAMFKNSSGQRFATVAIGSGYRSRPLNTTTDERFYTFFDYDVAKPDLLTIEDSNLQPVINHTHLALLDMSLTATQTNGADVTGKKGWYVDFAESGEKSLASGFIFKEKLVFTTYSPTQVSVSNCSPVTGQTNLYAMCMPYGKMCWADGSEPDGFDNYKKTNVMAGLGGEPQLIMTENEESGEKELNILVGTSIDKGVFKDTPAGGAKLVPVKKWREKTKK